MNFEQWWKETGAFLSGAHEDVAKAAFTEGKRSVLTVEDSKFIETFNKVSGTVSTWPKWKRELFGSYKKGKIV